MIPYSYNMVDMGGIDLAEANRTVVPGIYEKIVEAMNLCGDLILYNWKFAGIEIAPSACAVLQQDNSILINGMIQVTELDQITVIGVPSPHVPVSPLDVSANGTYEAESPNVGFNPVRVAVPGPNLIPYIYIERNGPYVPPPGFDGFAIVGVNVPVPALAENASVYRWVFSGGSTCWGIMRKYIGDVIGQNGDNNTTNISLVGSLITVTFHGNSQSVEVVANAAIKLKAYTTGRSLGPATMAEYTMSANEQQNFTMDNLYGGIYFEATEI